MRTKRYPSQNLLRRPRLSLSLRFKRRLLSQLFSRKLLRPFNKLLRLNKLLSQNQRRSQLLSRNQRFNKLPLSSLPLPTIARIDYIWHTPDLITQRAWVGGRGASDHRPVLARLHLAV